MAGNDFDFVSGDVALQKRLKEVGGRVSRLAIFLAIKDGMKVVQKAIKREVKKPSVRRSIGMRFDKKSGFGYRAKVGGGVGKRNKEKGGKKGGVGISKRNVHWYLLGTEVRLQYKGKRRTGKMPSSNAVQLGFAKASPRAMNVMRVKIWRHIEKETAKLKNKK